MAVAAAFNSARMPLLPATSAHELTSATSSRGGHLRRGKLNVGRGTSGITLALSLAWA